MVAAKFAVTVSAPPRMLVAYQMALPAELNACAYVFPWVSVTELIVVPTAEVPTMMAFPAVVLLVNEVESPLTFCVDILLVDCT